MKTITIAKALVLDSNGHMLLLRRSSTHPTMAGKADLPGGLIDEGEEPGQAVVREIGEETALAVDFDQLQMVYAGANVYDGENRVRMLYIVRLDTEKPAVRISWEHESAEWVPVENLAKLETEFHSFYSDALHHIVEHKLLEA